jgi:GT2 family glycosyltransferase
MQVGCVVVTYNKINMLKECIQAIFNQSRKVDYVYLIDNCSSDETQDYAEKLAKVYSNVHYYRLDKNIGGAGGFNYGLKMAYKEKMDYIWMMDNDTIPCETALENLLVHTTNSKINLGFLCSRAQWVDGKPCIMNIPTVGESWTEFLSEKLIRLKSASFVSLLIPRYALEKVGYPIKEFFIWGDDVEFTSRISKHYDGYLVTDSIVIHKMGKNETTDILRDEPNRIGRYYFDYRNRVFMAKKDGKKQFAKTYLRTFLMLFKILVVHNDSKFKKFGVVLKGLIAGTFFNPCIEKTNHE